MLPLHHHGICIVFSLDSHSLESHSLGSHSLESHSLESHSLQSHSLGSHSLESHSLESHSLESHSLGSHSLKSYITPYLETLHWLPISHLILLKYIFLISMVMNILSSLIKSSSLTHGNRLLVSSIRHKTMTGRHFRVLAFCNSKFRPMTIKRQAVMIVTINK